MIHWLSYRAISAIILDKCEVVVGRLRNGDVFSFIRSFEGTFRYK